jgi:hypothetical protein
MTLSTYLTEEIPSSFLQIKGDSEQPYRKIIDYLRAVGEIVSSPNTADSREETYVFNLLPLPREQIVVVRRVRNSEPPNYYFVEVYVIGRNASAINKNLVTLVRKGGRKRYPEYPRELTDR